MAAKKPRSGVPNDLPKTIIKEFAPKLALPISIVIPNIQGHRQRRFQKPVQEHVPGGLPGTRSWR